MKGGRDKERGEELKRRRKNYFYVLACSHQIFDRFIQSSRFLKLKAHWASSRSSECSRSGFES